MFLKQTYAKKKQPEVKKNMPTINDEIQKIINNTLQQQPTPQIVTITHVYDDNNHIDAVTKDGDEYTYIPTISQNPTTDNKGVLIPLENNTHIIITT